MQNGEYWPELAVIEKSAIRRWVWRSLPLVKNLRTVLLTGRR
jgi:hypothetical protein